MRAIILAGGLGRRLGSLTRCTQKCLLEVGDESILAHTLGMLFAAGVAEVSVVTGHCAGLVRAEVQRRFRHERCTFVHDEDYAANGTAYPLWLARFAVNEPLMLIDGDVVFERAVLTRLLAASRRDVLAVAACGTSDGDHVKVEVDDLGRVRRFGRTIDGTHARAARGLAVLSRRALTHLFPILERRVITERRVEERYESAFQELVADRGLVLRAVDVGHLRCVDVDTIDDLRRARGAFADDPQTTRAAARS